MSLLLADFGTEKAPLRASKLDALVRCALAEALEFMGEIHKDSGVAADTGSAIHKAVHAFHGRRDVPAALAAMREFTEEYPLADLRRAEKLFRLYAQDPRNQIDLPADRREVRVAFDCGFWVKGTVDQIREDEEGLAVWDLKTGQSLEGHEMLGAHVFQVAAYAVGASELIGRPVRPGGLIRTADYGTKKPVFWRYALTHKDALRLVAVVGRAVEAVRRGEVWPSPGRHCDWCPLGGVVNCFHYVENLHGTKSCF